MLKFENKDFKNWPPSLRDDVPMDGDVVVISKLREQNYYKREDKIYLVEPKTGVPIESHRYGVYSSSRDGKSVTTHKDRFEKAMQSTGNENLSLYPTLFQLLTSSYRPVPLQKVLEFVKTGSSSFSSRSSSSRTTSTRSSASRVSSSRDRDKPTSFQAWLPLEFGPELEALNNRGLPDNSGLDSETARTLVGAARWQRPRGYVLPHPNFSKIRIRRLNKVEGKEEKEEEVIELDLLAHIKACTDETPSEKCRALDIDLQPGDIVELPVYQDRIEKPWSGFDQATARFFEKALTYEVRIPDRGRARRSPQNGSVERPLVL